MNRGSNTTSSFRPSGSQKTGGTNPQRTSGNGPTKPRQSAGEVEKQLQDEERSRDRVAQPRSNSGSQRQSTGLSSSRRSVTKPSVPSHRTSKGSAFGELEDHSLAGACARKSQDEHQQANHRGGSSITKQCSLKTNSSTPHVVIDPKLLTKVKAIPFAAELFSLTDTDQDGQINKSEWIDFQKIVQEQALELSLVMCCDGDSFDDADVDHDGIVDLQEWSEYIKAVIEILGEKEWKSAAQRISSALSARDEWHHELKHQLELVGAGREADENDTGTELGPHSSISKEKDSRNIRGDPLEFLVGKRGHTHDNWLRPDANKFVRFSLGEVTLLEQYFTLRDIDGSGCLNWHELMLVIADLGRTPKNCQDKECLERLRNLADKDDGNSLNFNEFLGFLAAYFQTVYERVFKSYDYDQSGTIDMYELKNVLHQLGKAGFEIDWLHVEDLIATVNGNYDGTLGFESFCELMSAYRNVEFQALKTYAGFPMEKVIGLKTIFENHDEDYSDCLSIEETALLLQKVSDRPDKSLNTMLELQVVAGLYVRMDKDLSGGLCFEEFLRFLRVWTGDGHYPKVEDVSALSRETFDTVQDEIISGWAEDVRRSIEDQQLAQALGLDLQTICTMREVCEFCLISDAVLEKLGEDKEDIKLVKVLEQLGECVSSQSPSQRKTFAAVCSGLDVHLGLAFPEALKIICHYYEALAEELVPAQGMPREDVLHAFFKVGWYLKPESCEALLAEQGEQGSQSIISRECFLKMLYYRRDLCIQEWRASLGFGKEELENFRDAFARVPTNGTDPARRTLDEIKIILETLGYVTATSNNQQRVAIFRSLLRVSKISDPTMTFDELLRVLRLLDNYQRARRSWEVRLAINENNLEHAVVLHLQTLFLRKDSDRDDKLLQREVVQLYLEIKGKNEMEVMTKEGNWLAQVKDCVGRAARESETRTLSFLEFVRCLKELENLSS